MNVMQSAARRAVLLYGVRVPYHRGKWRVIDGVLHAFKLDQAEKGTVVEAERQGFRFALDISRFMDRTLYYHGGFESYDIHAARTLVRPGAVVLDVGANIGWWTLHLQRWAGPQGRVLAFEPDASERARLERNLALNGCSTVTVSPEAISDTVGEAWLSPTYDGGTTHLVDDPGQAAGRVPVTTVDAVAEREGLTRLDFVKCDIEGAELRFLAGAEHTLRRFRPTLMVELFEPNLRAFGTSRAELTDRIRALGYKLFRAHGWRLEPMDALPDEGLNVNLFAIPR